jgi:hypothetical protein
MTLMIFLESEFWDGYHKNSLSSPLEKKREKWRTYNIGKRLVITYVLPSRKVSLPWVILNIPELK